MNPGPPERPATKAYGEYLRFMGLGLTMAGIVLGSTFLGWWLDRSINWRLPVLTIVLALLGVVGAMLYLFKETGKRPGTNK